ncbi:MAG: sulfotransferase family protein [Bacteroidota bacterium]
MEATRICIWSGPRNISTALMYAFAQRQDTEVFDEPLYAHYLRVSGAQHPGRDQVLQTQEQDGEKVVRDQILGPATKPVLFFKQMAHHLVELDESFLDRVVNVFLIRDPSLVLASFSKVIPHPALGDIGIARQYELYQQLKEQGQDPLVIDGPELLKNPEAVLRSLCEKLRLAFEPAMLTWEAGPIPQDGVWAPYWYANVHQSTGFQPYQPKTVALRPDLQAVAQQAAPFYTSLFDAALKA